MLGWILFLLVVAVALAFGVSIIRRARTDRRRMAIALEESTATIAALRREVEDRTAAVVSVEKELEWLTYAVSHDLRAPVRAIEGFAGMLQEDYADRLDNEANRRLRVVRDSAAKLDRLIDGLLALSRASQQPIISTNVDMAALARRAMDDVCSAAGGTRPELVIHELPATRADTSLLYQVWYRLIENAVIYTGRNPSPRIEIGGAVAGGESTYYVHDNGVGFDMRNHHRLFNVFQRLHREGEFPGIGVGLAVVERIVTRHGGRVWAEGAPGQGARFSFSLPVGG